MYIKNNILQEAIIPLYDKIFTRIGTSDNMEYNASTFSVEMMEISNILDQITPNSLVLIDELGRGYIYYYSVQHHQMVLVLVGQYVNI